MVSRLVRLILERVVPLAFLLMPTTQIRMQMPMEINPEVVLPLVVQTTPPLPLVLVRKRITDLEHPIQQLHLVQLLAILVLVQVLRLRVVLEVPPRLERGSVQPQEPVSEQQTQQMVQLPLVGSEHQRMLVSVHQPPIPVLVRPQQQVASVHPQPIPASDPQTYHLVHRQLAVSERPTPPSANPRAPALAPPPQDSVSAATPTIRPALDSVSGTQTRRVPRLQPPYRVSLTTSDHFRGYRRRVLLQQMEQSVGSLDASFQTEIVAIS